MTKRRLTSFVIPDKMQTRKKRLIKKRCDGEVIGTSMTLKKDQLDWCNANIRHHWYLYEKEIKYLRKLRIVFFEKSDAMLFKLTWL
jgi:hypothetical protein